MRSWPRRRRPTSWPGRTTALYAAEDSIRDLVGIPLGAVLFAAAVSLPFLLDRGTFAFSALVVASMRLTRTRAQVVAATPGEFSPTDPAGLHVGVAYLRGHRVLRRLVGLWSAQALWFGATFTILVYYALHALDLTAAGYGLLGAASWGGDARGEPGPAGPVISTRDRGYTVVLLLVTATAALGYLIVAVAGGIVVAAAGLFVWGAGIATGNVAVSTLRDDRFQSSYYGRVFTVRDRPQPDGGGHRRVARRRRRTRWWSPPPVVPGRRRAGGAARSRWPRCSATGRSPPRSRPPKRPAIRRLSLAVEPGRLSSLSRRTGRGRSGAGARGWPSHIWGRKCFRYMALPPTTSASRISVPPAATHSRW